MPDGDLRVYRFQAKEADLSFGCLANVPVEGVMGRTLRRFQVGNQAPLSQQEFHVDVAKIHSRLDRLNSRLHLLSEERISRLETEIGDVKRLLERCLNTTHPGWNEGC